MDLILEKKPSETQASIRLPLSKSISNRLIIIKALSSVVEASHVANCKDSISLFHAVEFGSNDINVGDAGTPYRFLMAYLSYVGIPVQMDGSKRMRERPIAELVEALESLGAEIRYLDKKGYPPIQIKSGIKRGGKVRVKTTRSSQFVSALLLIAPYLKSGLQIELEGQTVSQAYIDMTIALMARFGVKVEVRKKTLIVPEGNYLDVPDFELERDWSAASYFYTFLSLSDTGNMLLNALKPQSIQGDSVCLKLFEAFGVHSEKHKEGVEIMRIAKTLTSFTGDLTSFPDIVPSIIIALCGNPGVHTLNGISHLEYKESKRLEVLKTHLSQLNVEMHVDGDLVTIDTRNFKPNPNFVVETNEDHRMAMSLACLVQINAVVKIKSAEVVEKSFPEFWQEFAKIARLSHVQ